MYTPLPNAEIVNVNIYAKNSKHDNDYIPDLLTDAEPSTG